MELRESEDASTGGRSLEGVEENASSGHLENTGPESIDKMSELNLLEMMELSMSVPMFGGEGINKTPCVGLPEDFLAYLFRDSKPASGSQDPGADFDPPLFPTFATVASPTSVYSRPEQPFREITQWLDFGNQTGTLPEVNRIGQDSNFGSGINPDPVVTRQREPLADESRDMNLGREDEILFTDSGYASAPKLKITSVPDAQNRSGDTDLEDSRTLYSTATTLAPAHAKRYVTDLAQDIYSQLEDALVIKDRSILFDSLPELVKAFAIRLAHDSSSVANREIMYFIHKRHG